MDFDKKHQELYDFIARNNPCSREDISSAFDALTPDELENALHTLQDSKLISYSDITKRYSTLRPHDAFYHTNAVNYQKIAELSAEILNNERSFQNFLDSYTVNATSDDEKINIQVLHTIEQTQELLIKMGPIAKSHIYNINTPPGFGLDKIILPNKDLLKLLNPELHIYSITTTHGYSVERQDELLDVWSVIPNFEKRMLDSIPFQIMLYDDLNCLIASKKFPREGKAYYFENHGIASILKEIFLSIWEQAAPFGKVQDSNLTVKELEERRIIFSMLFNGSTDQEVCEALGISSRTFRRRMQSYIDYVEARTRSQLLLYAYKHNWDETEAKRINPPLNK